SAAFAERAVEADPAAMPFDHHLDERKAEAYAVAALFVSAEEGRKDDVVLLRIDPLPVVPDVADDIRLSGMRGGTRLASSSARHRKATRASAASSAQTIACPIAAMPT